MKNWAVTNVQEAERHLCSRLAAAIARDRGESIVEEPCRFRLIDANTTTSDITNLIFLLGTYGEAAKIRRKSGGYKVVDPANAHGLVQVTASMLATWPKNFHVLMREVGGYGRPDVVWHEPPGYFLAFAKAVRKNRDSPACKFIAKEYDAFMTENWQGLLNRRHSWATSDHIESQLYMTPLAAAMALRIARHQIIGLLNQNILRGFMKKAPGKRAFLVIEKASLRNAEEFFHDRVSISSAALLLGLARARVEELIAAGFLQLVCDPKAPKARLLSRKEIAIFVKRLSTRSREPEDGEIILTASAVLKTHLATDNDEFLYLVNALLTGGLIPIKTTLQGAGMGNLAFCRKQFYKWRGEMRSEKPDSGLTVIEAARRLGEKQEVVYHLVRTGLLRSSADTIRKRKFRMIRPEDIEEFQAEYLETTRLMRLFDTNARGVVKRLSELDVRPATGPGVDSCRKYFYRCQEVASSLSLTLESFVLSLGE